VFIFYERRPFFIAYVSLFDGSNFVPALDSAGYRVHPNAKIFAFGSRKFMPHVWNF